MADPAKPPVLPMNAILRPNGRLFLVAGAADLGPWRAIRAEESVWIAWGSDWSVRSGPAHLAIGVSRTRTEEPRPLALSAPLNPEIGRTVFELAALQAVADLLIVPSAALVEGADRALLDESVHLLAAIDAPAGSDAALALEEAFAEHQARQAHRAASRVRQRPRDSADELVDPLGVFPGVSAWFWHRRRHAQAREQASLEALRKARPGLVIDVPVAGADWPFGAPVDVDRLERLAREHEFDLAELRIYTTPDPPGAVMRIRADANGRATTFAETLCRETRSEEEERRILCSPPFAAYAAQLCGHWMGTYAPTGLVPTAPPDPLAAALATLATSLVTEDTEPPGDRSEDIVLGAVDYAYHTTVGRARLRELARRMRATGRDIELAAGREGWRIVGLGIEDQASTLRTDLMAEAALVVRDVPDTGLEEFHAPGEHEEFISFLGRLGLGILASLAGLPDDAGPAAVAAQIAGEHGLCAGLDGRVGAFAVAMRDRHPLDALDMTLAIDRLSAIDTDPCDAHAVREALDAATTAPHPA